MTKKLIIISVLVLYTLIIFLPPLIHGYVYPNNGDDSAFHLRYLSLVQNGQSETRLYPALDIVGYPLIWISDLTHISLNSLYLWFNFIILWLIGIVNFFIVAKLVNWKSGLFAVIMVLFMTPSTLNLFDNGSIYDLMTVGILLPIWIYCVVKLWYSKRWYWMIPIVLVILPIFFMHTFAILGGKGNSPIVSPSQFVSIFVGIMTIVIIFISAIIVIPQYYRIKPQSKYLALILISISVILAVLTFTGVIGWNIRIATDLGIVLSILGACLLGIVLDLYKRKLIMAAMSLVVLGSSAGLMLDYCSYNSAMKSIDKEVVEYVNSLGGQYYSCSPEIAPWIYDRFINKKYKEGELPYISRNKPMTNRTNPDAKDYWWRYRTTGYTRNDYSNPIPNYLFDNAIKFKEGDLELYVIQ